MWLWLVRVTLTPALSQWERGFDGGLPVSGDIAAAGGVSGVVRFHPAFGEGEE